MPITKTIKVLKVQSADYEVVLNVGSQDGITNNQRFLIYALGDEFIDPDTKENLGCLEIVRGTGVVSHLQEKLCTVRSDKKTKTWGKKVITEKKSPYSPFGFSDKTITEAAPTETNYPFDEPLEGDFAKLITAYKKD